jgi:hypothetical protein
MQVEGQRTVRIRQRAAHGLRWADDAGRGLAKWSQLAHISNDELMPGFL